MEITRFDDDKAHKITFTFEIDKHIFAEFYMCLSPSQQKGFRTDGPISRHMFILAMVAQWVETRRKVFELGQKEQGKQ